MAISAVSSVSTPGVLVTIIPLVGGGLDVDMFEADAEIGDHLEAFGRGGEKFGVEPVIDRGYQHVAGLGRRQQPVARHRRHFEPQPGVEQFAHRVSTGSGNLTVRTTLSFCALICAFISFPRALCPRSPRRPCAAVRPENFRRG